MTQTAQNQLSDTDQNSQQNEEQTAQKQSPEETEKMSILPDEKMSIPSDEKMSIPLENKGEIDILYTSSEAAEKMSIPPVEEEEIDINATPVATQNDNLFTGEVDPTKLDEHGYAIRKADGTFIDAMCSPAEFDALLEELGFLLLDRVNWPLWHRKLVMEQAPRGKDGIFLVERAV